MTIADTTLTRDDLDGATVDQLVACGLLQEIVALYLNESATLLARIEAATATGDASALARAAHALRGASGSVGAGRVVHLCATVERDAKAGHLIHAFDAAAGLGQAVADATRELARRASSP